MNAICVAIDRLHAGFVGAYGNAWIETPGFDRLAAEAFVADQFFLPSGELAGVYEGFWRGRHVLQPPVDEPGLAARLADVSVETLLVTDEADVAKHPGGRGFDRVVQIDRPKPTRLAESIEATHLAECFGRLIGCIESAEEPFFLWCHLSGLAGAWDAPYEFRERYADPDDPPPPGGPEVPRLRLPPNHDPDELLGHTHAYAGQVTLLDTCLAALHEFLATEPAGQETLLTVVSPRGFPLGEHGCVGAIDSGLHGELLHGPLLMRFPDATGATVRSSALTHPADLWATLADWFWLDPPPQAATARGLLPLVRDEQDSLRDRLLFATPDGHRAIRTPAWFLRRTDRLELHAKPGDRWEVNEISDRCADIAHRLDEAITVTEAALQSGRLDELPPLDDDLMFGHA